MSGQQEREFDELHPEAYRTLVEGIPAVLYIDRPDDESTNLYTSPQVEELLGFTVHEWMDDPALWQRQIHPDDLEATIEANRESNELGQHFRAEYRFLTKEGRWVWIRDEATPVRDDEGTLLYWRGVMLDVTERREAEEKVRWSLDILRRTVQQRRELAQRLQSAQEAERRRIAGDIHDDPIQVMSAVDMRLQMLASFPENVNADDLMSIEGEVREAIERLRSLLFELRPTALDRDGLAAALRLYAEHTAKATDWTVEVRDSLSTEPDPDLAALIYRIAQEAITNSRKHAGADRVEVDIASAADGITLRVRDDGAGFVPDLNAPAQPGHLGLHTIVERAELVGGWVRVTSGPGEGTTVECWIPVDVAADARIDP